MFEALWSQLHSLIQQNQFLSGGLLLGFLGTLVASLRGVPGKLFMVLYRRLVFSVTMETQDTIQDWLQSWLATHEYTNKWARHLLLKSLDVTYSLAGLSYKYELSPAPGNHFILYQGKLLWVTFQRDKRSSKDDLFIGYEKSFTVNILFGNRKVVDALLEDIRVFKEAQRVTKSYLYTVQGSNWRYLDELRPRSAESLVYEGDLMDEVLEDARQFFAEEKWYASMGIPWRRGYLLYGEPGNGKSSLVTALASELKRDVFVVNLGSAEINDDSLPQLLQNSGRGRIILLEEIDTIFNGREKVDTSLAASGLTFGGLLNALDGVLASEGRLLIMTTNHPERLDPALIRPGRADRKIYIGNASHVQLQRMFQRFYPETTGLAERFASQLPEGKISMARVQEHFMVHRNDPLTAVTTAPMLVDPPAKITPERVLEAAAT